MVEAAEYYYATSNLSTYLLLSRPGVIFLTQTICQQVEGLVIRQNTRYKMPLIFCMRSDAALAPHHSLASRSETGAGPSQLAPYSGLASRIPIQQHG